MGYEVIPMGKDTYRIEDGGVRFFLLSGTEKALLIDSGMTVRNAKEIAKTLTDLPVYLLNTHADRDHTGSNAEFDWVYMHPAEEPFYRKSGIQGTVRPVREGDVLDLGERELEIVELPGHTPGSIAVLDRRNRVLISGDPIQRDGRIFMFGEHRNFTDYIASLKRLEKRTETFDEIWPSHGTIPIPPETVEKLRKGAEDILSGKVPGTLTAFRELEITVYDLGFTTLLCPKEMQNK